MKQTAFEREQEWCIEQIEGATDPKARRAAEVALRDLEADEYEREERERQQFDQRSDRGMERR